MTISNVHLITCNISELSMGLRILRVMSREDLHMQSLHNPNVCFRPLMNIIDKVLFVWIVVRLGV